MLNHLWIIMDGNRRWAKERFLPSSVWHKAWAENIKKIVKLASEKNIKYLTLWALSKDNLKKREPEEVENILKLINRIWEFLWEMLENDVKLRVIWDLDDFPQETIESLKKVVNDTKTNVWTILTIALNYWWQDEIIRATKKIIKNWIDPDTLTKEEFRKYLDTSYLPNPDLIIRTGWDVRHSGFLLFDSEYSEYFFTEKKWPEFDKNELEIALKYFENSKRNFWK